MITLLIYAAISICFSFLCSIWEAVLLSITPSFVNTELQKGSSLGKSLDKFKQDIDRPLSAILTLNTIAHTLGAIGVGAAATVVFADMEAPVPFLTWDMIVAVVMTLLILFLSEIIPKTIGANNWKSLAPFTVKSLSIMLKVLAPLIWVSQLITKSFKKEKGKGVLTRTDFLALANVGMNTGALEASESSIISNLLGMDTLKVQDVMTPRTVMQMKDENMSMEEYYNTHKPMRFSRIPIFSGKPDSITGMVLKDDILTNLVEGNKEKTLLSIKREVKMIHQDKTLKELFAFLTDDDTHLAIVHDNYGSVTGVVTMEDMLETILGMEIVDESDKVADLQQLARKSWEERAKKLGIIE